MPIMAYMAVKAILVAVSGGCRIHNTCSVFVDTVTVELFISKRKKERKPNVWNFDKVVRVGGAIDEMCAAGVWI